MPQSLDDKLQMEEIAEEVRDKGSKFWDLVAQKVAEARGVPISDETHAEVRDAQQQVTVSIE